MYACWTNKHVHAYTCLYVSTRKWTWLGKHIYVNVYINIYIYVYICMCSPFSASVLSDVRDASIDPSSWPAQIAWNYTEKIVNGTRLKSTCVIQTYSESWYRRLCWLAAGICRAVLMDLFSLWFSILRFCRFVLGRCSNHPKGNATAWFRGPRGPLYRTWQDMDLFPLPVDKTLNSMLFD